MKNENICASCRKRILSRDDFYQCLNRCCIWCIACGGKAEGHGGKGRVMSRASRMRILKRHALVASLFK